jgi:hypothetical protein
VVRGFPPMRDDTALGWGTRHPVFCETKLRGYFAATSPDITPTPGT